MKDEDLNALFKLLEQHIRPEAGSKRKREEQREEPPYQNEYPFAFHDRFLEYIGFAASSFSIFLEFNPFASKKEMCIRDSGWRGGAETGLPPPGRRGSFLYGQAHDLRQRVL